MCLPWITFITGSSILLVGHAPDGAEKIYGDIRPECDEQGHRALACDDLLHGTVHCFYFVQLTWLYVLGNSELVLMLVLAF